MSPGNSSLRSSYPRPYFASVPVLKFSARMSLPAMRRRAIACPSGCPRLRVTDRLLRFVPAKYALSELSVPSARGR